MWACGLGLNLSNELSLGLEFVRAELAHLLDLASRKGGPLEGVWV